MDERVLRWLVRRNRGRLGNADEALSLQALFMVTSFEAYLAARPLSGLLFGRCILTRHTRGRKASGGHCRAPEPAIFQMAGYAAPLKETR